MEMNYNKWIKTNIRLGSIVKEKVGDMEERKKEGRRSSMQKDVVGCVQAMTGKNNFVVKF